MKRDELNLKTEYAKALAREEAYRLELAAATVSVRLNKLLKNELEIPTDKIATLRRSLNASTHSSLIVLLSLEKIQVPHNGDT